MTALCFDCGTARYLACRTLGALWPGAYFSSIAPVRLRPVESPAELPAGWARVRVHQCGLCASDVHMLHLAFSPFISPIMFEGSSPGAVVLGHELLGTVTDVAEGCPLRPGQRVVSRSAGFRNCMNRNVEPCPRCAAGEYTFCLRQRDPPPACEPVRSGGFAPAYFDHAANLVPVPDALDDDAAVVAEPLAVALRAVLALPRAVRSPGRLLVIGAGIQGLAAVHWAHCLRPDLSIACAARYPFQAEMARTLGASDVLTGRTDAARLAPLLGTSLARGMGRRAALVDGFDLIIDTIGTPRSLQDALDWTRPGGTVLVVGAYLKPGRLDYSPLWYREVTVRGVYAHGAETFEGRRVGTIDLALDLLATRARLPLKLVTHRVPLRDYRQAVALSEDKARSHAVRVVLQPDELR